METKFDKLQALQENATENAKDKSKRNEKKSSKVSGPIITGWESQGMIKTSMSDIPKERWEKIFGKKDTKAKSNKKT